MAYLQLKHYGVHLHGLDVRDTYTNLIINDNDGNCKAKNATYQLTYEVKTVENLFHGADICSQNSTKFISWCGHQRYPMTEINQS